MRIFRCRRSWHIHLSLLAILTASLLGCSDHAVVAFVTPKAIGKAVLIQRQGAVSSTTMKKSSSRVDATKSAASSGMPKAAPSQVKGVLLDMDGTMTDSDTLHFEAYRETLAKVTPHFNEGKLITREWYDEWMSGNSNPAIVEKLFPDMPAEEQTALWKSKEEIYREISTKLTPLPGLLVFLERCKAAGIATIVVTNAPRIDAVHTLKVLGLFERFGETMVIGYECARSKPNPDPYEEGLSKLGLTADVCVAFEDSVNGIKSAVAAGLYTIGVGDAPIEKLQGVGAGICVRDYLDSRLPTMLGLDSTDKYSGGNCQF